MMFCTPAANLSPTTAQRKARVSTRNATSLPYAEMLGKSFSRYCTTAIAVTASDPARNKMSLPTANPEHILGITNELMAYSPPSTSKILVKSGKAMDCNTHKAIARNKASTIPLPVYAIPTPINANTPEPTIHPTPIEIRSNRLSFFSIKVPLPRNLSFYKCRIPFIFRKRL